MKKRILSVLMAVLLIVGMLPSSLNTMMAEAKGGSGSGRPGGGIQPGTVTNGTDLGWEYAHIEENSDGGYDLTDPDSSLDSNGRNYLSVEYSGTTGTWAEGTSGLKADILNSTSEETVTIKALTDSSGKYQYYIAAVVIACGHTDGGEPFYCTTVAGDNAMAFAEPGSSLFKIELTIPNIYTHANHNSGASDYYLMIMMEPVPDVDYVYVGYNAGVAGTTAITAAPVEAADFAAVAGDATAFPNQVSSYWTLKYETPEEGSPTHKALEVSDAAKEQAYELGYEFAGWKLEYFTDYTENTNVFENASGVTSTINELTDVTLALNAKLTALWEPIETVDITVNKVWEDEDDAAELRPGKVYVQLYENSVAYGDAVELNADNSWTYTWSGLNYENVSGAVINYTVAEVDGSLTNAEKEKLAMYHSEITGSAASGFTITNTLELVDVTINKQWDHGDNSTLPTEIVVHLLENNEHTGKTARLNEQNNWFYTWQNLPKEKAGAEITYSVWEVQVENYETTLVSRVGNVITIKNTYDPATTYVAVTKDWQDNNDQDGKRPASVTFQLQQKTDASEWANVGDAVSVDAGDSWYYYWPDLPTKDANDKEITYQVIEVNVPDGYTSSGPVQDTKLGNVFTITNTHTPEKIDVINVSKVWNDDVNEDGKDNDYNNRPDSVYAQLYADDVAYGDPVELNKENNWLGQWTNLDKYKAGKEINYTVKESSVAGYTSAVTGDVSKGFTITNTPEMITFKAIKKWVNDEGITRPTSITLHLEADGSHSEGRKATLTAAEHDKDGDGIWEYTWEPLPKYINGSEVNWVVLEKDVDIEAAGYMVTYERAVDASNPNQITVTITNTYDANHTYITVTKIWNESTTNPNRPTEVVVDLWGSDDSHRLGTLNESNAWTYTFTLLPIVDSSGTAIEYTARERATAGYVVSYVHEDEDLGRVVKIANTPVDETIDISVTKEWDDGQNQDNIRPDSIVVNLLVDDPTDAQEATVYDSATLNEDNSWSYTWEGLAIHLYGTNLEYSVEEAAVPEGYTHNPATDITGTEADGFTITNHYTPKTTSVKVTKDWDDNNNQDGKRPASVTVKLLADGVDTGKTVTLSESNGWSDTFTGLDKNKAGVAIVYTVEESTVPAGYAHTPDTDVTGNATDGYTITNRYSGTYETTSVKVTKSWDDNNNQAGKRPTNVTIELLANGEVVDSVELSEENNWSYTFTNLAKNKAGVEIVYTIDEPNVAEGYGSKVSGDALNGFIVTNSYPAPTATPTPAPTATPTPEPTATPTPEPTATPTPAPTATPTPEPTATPTPAPTATPTPAPTATPTPEPTATPTPEPTATPTPTPAPTATPTPEPTATPTPAPTATPTPEPTATPTPEPTATPTPEPTATPTPEPTATPTPEPTATPTPAPTATPTPEPTATPTPEPTATPTPAPTATPTPAPTATPTPEPTATPTPEPTATPTPTPAPTATPTPEPTATPTPEPTATPTPEPTATPTPEPTATPTPEPTATPTPEPTATPTPAPTATPTPEPTATPTPEPTATPTPAPTATPTPEPTATPTPDSSGEDVYGFYTITKIWDDNHNAAGIRPDSVWVQVYTNGVTVADVVLNEENGWSDTLVLLAESGGEECVYTIAEINVPAGYTASYDQTTLTVVNSISGESSEEPTPTPGPGGTDNSTTIDPSKDVPQTDDSSNLSLYCMLAFASLVAMAGFAINSKKKESEAI